MTTAAEELADLRDRLQVYVAELRNQSCEAETFLPFGRRSIRFIADELERQFLLLPSAPAPETRAEYVREWEPGAGE